MKGSPITPCCPKQKENTRVWCCEAGLPLPYNQIKTKEPMKQLIRMIACAMLVLAISHSASAQKSQNLIGFRAGYGGGLTFQHYLSESRAAEFILFSRWRGFNLTALYEVHGEAFDVKNLYWFFGGGGHIGTYTYYNNGRFGNTPFTGTRTTLGLDGIIGLEYFFQDIPFQVSVDWKPTFSLAGYYGFYGDEGAISVRYVF